MTVEIALAKRKYEKNYSQKIKTDSGEVRIYDEAHVKQRWKKKVNKLKSLESGIKKLRTKYKADLKSDDPKVRALAAIVGLIDETAMRVGNDDSVDEFGTFGATTLKKEHARVSGSKIRFKFKGKKGVDQDVEVSDSAVVKELKALMAGKKGKDFIFEYEDDKRIRAKVVNRYLADFGITAKDIRGFHANHLMKQQLKKTKDFDKALESVADEVGHEEKTLMNQYLDPALVKKYKKASLEPAQVFENLIKTILVHQDKSDEFSMLSRRREHREPIRITEDQDIKHHITSPYGMRISPIDGKHRHHDGIDFSAHVGDVVHAFGDGTVTRAGWQNPNNHKAGFGQRVYVDHGEGLVSIYAHLSAIYVNVGDHISEGEPIGEAGSTGSSTGPHLHFELHLNGEKIDPSEYLSDKRLI